MTQRSNDLSLTMCWISLVMCWCVLTAHLIQEAVQAVYAGATPTVAVEAPPSEAPPSWALDACARLCTDVRLPSVVLPSEKPEHGGWQCFCDPTQPQE